MLNSTREGLQLLPQLLQDGKLRFFDPNGKGRQLGLFNGSNVWMLDADKFFNRLNDK